MTVQRDREVGQAQWRSVSVFGDARALAWIRCPVGCTAVGKRRCSPHGRVVVTEGGSRWSLEWSCSGHRLVTGNAWGWFVETLRLRHLALVGVPSLPDRVSQVGQPRGCGSNLVESAVDDFFRDIRHQRGLGGWQL